MFLQRNMLREVLRRPGARALDRTPGEALSVFRDDVQYAEDGADWTIDMTGHLIFAALAMAILVRVNSQIAIFVFFVQNPTHFSSQGLSTGSGLSWPYPTKSGWMYLMNSSTFLSSRWQKCWSTHRHTPR